MTLASQTSQVGSQPSLKRRRRSHYQKGFQNPHKLIKVWLKARPADQILQRRMLAPLPARNSLRQLQANQTRKQKPSIPRHRTAKTETTIGEKLGIELQLCRRGQEELFIHGRRKSGKPPSSELPVLLASKISNAVITNRRLMRAVYIHPLVYPLSPLEASHSPIPAFEHRKYLRGGAKVSEHLCPHSGVFKAWGKVFTICRASSPLQDNTTYPLAVHFSTPSCSSRTGLAHPSVIIKSVRKFISRHVE